MPRILRRPDGDVHVASGQLDDLQVTDAAAPGQREFVVDNIGNHR